MSKSEDKSLTAKECMQRTEEVIMHTYNRYPIVWDKGSGVDLYDIEGKKYLDFVSGIAVHALGYENEKWKTAIKDQLDKLTHISNYYYSVPMMQAAENVTKASGMDRVFFTNSGTEAVEGAIKTARKYYYNKKGKADSEIIAMDHSFHGRSLGSLSVTGTKKYREAFEPLIGGAVFATYNDLEDVRSKITDKTAAILLETIQGEGGVYPATKEFITGIRKLCDEHDILMILDEIQCGMGRTGTMFAYENYGVKPDVVTIAKALGCGIPVGAFATTEKAAALVAGDHGTTYGGNPLAMAAVNAVFDQFEELQILEHVKMVGAYLFEQLELVKEKYDCIIGHRGVGLIQGLEFCVPVGDIIKKAIEGGLILINAGADVIRFVPPLVIEKEHVDEMIRKLTASIDAVM